MDDEKENSESRRGEEPVKSLCTCISDPFASLPADLRPHSRDALSDLRKVKCPVCGLIYWTNREADLCIQCEKKGLGPPEANAQKE